MFIGEIPNAPSEQRARVLSESDVEKGKFILNQPTYSGAYVTTDSAMRFVTFYACVRVICEDLASLPLKLYKRREDGGRIEAREKSLYRILHRRPNYEQTTMDFIELMTMDMIVTGVARARIVIDGSGQVTELRRMHPGRTRTKRTANGDVVFEWLADDDKLYVLGWEEVLKVHGPFGMSVLEYMRETIGQALIQERYASKFFGSFGRPGGVIQMKKSFQDEEAIKKFKRHWHDTYAGIENAYNLAILEEGAEWRPVEIKNNDAQFLESRKLSDNQICAGMRVPPHMVGILDRATFSNIESQQLSYYMQGLRAHCVRWEMSLERDLLLASEEDSYYMQFVVDAILRGDIATRQAFYASGRQNGFLSANDIRAKEDMNPIGEQGDVYLVQAGYNPANLVAEQTELSGTTKTAPAPNTGKEANA